MRKRIWIWGLVAVSVFMVSLTFQEKTLKAENLSPKEIAKRVDNRDDGETSTSELTMILVDRNKNERIRKMKSFRKSFGKDTKSISFFLSPADVKNTAFMSYEWDDENKEDDNWLYLPALRKVKRIASGNKKDSFMGSDFSYVDMNGPEIEDWDYKFVKESEKVNGHDCWVIEAVPKASRRKRVIDETGYLKRVSWIRKDNFMAVRGKTWVKKGKKIKFFEALDIEKISGIWTAKKLEMTTTKKNRLEHKTILLFDKITYNEGLKDDMFNTQRMERGL
ncbi:MAG: outer membrane lipoprotein-sorting protein [Deltaproteobacteria bacterium]|nr:outer membrane lipoprotein-sorting protein [Deltaproteobacteria bacterium]